MFQLPAMEVADIGEFSLVILKLGPSLIRTLE